MVGVDRRSACARDNDQAEGEEHFHHEGVRDQKTKISQHLSKMKVDTQEFAALSFCTA